MKVLLEKLLIGKRIIMFRSGYTKSGKDCHVCIGVITTVGKNDKFMSYTIGIKQYGYDLKEEHYALDSYTWGGYSLKETIDIFIAQPLLRKQFKGVNIKLNPDAFYESEKLISNYNSRG